MRENQITPARTPKRRKQKPLSLGEAFSHLQRRAALMQTKPTRVWLRWNRADVEAVETILAAVKAKIPRK